MMTSTRTATLNPSSKEIFDIVDDYASMIDSFYISSLLAFLSISNEIIGGKHLYKFQEIASRTFATISYILTAAD